MRAPIGVTAVLLLCTAVHAASFSDLATSAKQRADAIVATGCPERPGDCAAAKSAIAAMDKADAMRRPAEISHARKMQRIAICAIAALGGDPIPGIEPLRCNEVQSRP